jgi:hypothetical protein
VAPLELAAKNNEILALNALLIQPVQRVPRYKLLLERLLKYTGQSHPDAGPLEKAVGDIDTVCKASNEKMNRSLQREEIRKLSREVGESLHAHLKRTATQFVSNPELLPKQGQPHRKVWPRVLTHTSNELDHVLTCSVFAQCCPPNTACQARQADESKPQGAASTPAAPVQHHTHSST